MCVGKDLNNGIHTYIHTGKCHNALIVTYNTNAGKCFIQTYTGASKSILKIT